MSVPAARRTGAPLFALTALLAGWVLLRTIIWQSPFPPPVQDYGVPGFAGAAPAPAAHHAPAAEGNAPEVIDHINWSSPFTRTLPVRREVPLNGRQLSLPAQVDRLDVPHEPLAPPLFPGQAAKAPSIQTHVAVITEAIALPSQAERQPVDRWSVDGWMLWRQSSGSALAAAAPSPSYGASQAGAVLRYRITPGSNHSPNAYVRATRALVSGGGSEIAAGFNALPIADLPLRGHAEMRATKQAGTTEIRPAAFMTTEILPQSLPMGLRATFYAQGGYVGGDFSTAFADGHLKISRDVAQVDLGTLNVGAGAWGGAQKGAARLDVGPSLGLKLERGPVPAHLSVDYRIRTAGDAQPGSGVTVTLTTGF